MTKQIKIALWILLFNVIILLIIKYEAGELNNQITRICCNDNCFDIEIADDDKSRELWLMNREHLDDDKWMLFIFDNPWIYSFRMKNTLIPLAWIWLDSDLEIVDIKLMDPCKTEECPAYTSKSEAKYVLEINQSIISEKWLLKIWDKFKLK